MDFQSTAIGPKPAPLAPGQKDGAPLIINPQASEKIEETIFTMDCVQRSEDYRNPFLDIMEELLQNYMVTFDVNASGGFNRAFWDDKGAGNRYQGRASGGSRLKDPETHQVVETLASQSLGLVFDSPDFLLAQPIGADDPEKARLLTRLLTAVFRQPNMFRTFYQAFKDSFILGTSILELGWEQDSRAQVTPNGGVEQVEFKNNFMMRSVDIFDFYPDPSGTRIQYDMEWVVKRFRISKPEASRLARRGVYNTERTRRALSKGSKTISTESHGELRFDPGQAIVPDQYGVLEGFEFWGRTPLKHGDGANNRVITILEGENVRSSINPFIDGNIPFKEIVVNPMTGRFYGLSPSEVIRFQQDSADNMLMTINDVTNAAAHGPLLVGGGFGGSMNRLHKRGLLDLIECSNPDMVKPLPIDINAIQLSMQEWTRRKQTMREASGASNPTQAIASSGRQTATEISELTRAASQRVELMTQIFEKDDLPHIGRTAHSRIRQFGPQSGLLAVLDGEQFEVRLEDIDFDSDVEFVGSRNAESRFQRDARFREVISLLSTNPEIVMSYPDLITRYFRDSLNFKDAAQIVQKAIESIQQKQIMDFMVNQSANEDAKEEAEAAGGPTSPQTSAEADFGTQAGQTEREGQAIA